MNETVLRLCQDEEISQTIAISLISSQEFLEIMQAQPKQELLSKISPRTGILNYIDVDISWVKEAGRLWHCYATLRCLNDSMTRLMRFQASFTRISNEI